MPLYPTQLSHLKKYRSLLTITPVCPLCDANSSLSTPVGWKQVSGQVAGRSGSGFVWEEASCPTSLDPAVNQSGKLAKIQINTQNLPWHSVSTHTFSLYPSLSVSLSMIALTLERPTVQMHTHLHSDTDSQSRLFANSPWHGHTYTRTHARTLTSTVLCGQAGG